MYNKIMINTAKGTIKRSVYTSGSVYTRGSVYTSGSVYTRGSVYTTFEFRLLQ